jgi:hypothetical protein
MPSRDRRRQKIAKLTPVKSKPSIRKFHFEAEPWEAEPWYAEAARKLSAVRKSAELRR